MAPGILPAPFLFGRRLWILEGVVLPGCSAVEALAAEAGRLGKPVAEVRSTPQALKRVHTFCDLRRGWKPRPFKTCGAAGSRALSKPAVRLEAAPFQNLRRGWHARPFKT